MTPDPGREPQNPAHSPAHPPADPETLHQAEVAGEQLAHEAPIEEIKRHPLHYGILTISSGLFTGYIPLASGTWATALAILLYLPLGLLNNREHIFIYVGICVALYIIGTMASTYAEKVHKEKDPHKVVIDEIVGYFFSVILLPPFHAGYLIAAFFIFRVLDVWKPTPIRQLQELPGGHGIMVDDALAGLYTCAILHGVRIAIERFA